MTLLTVEERKDISLCILEEIHNFCQKNSIQYFLDYGTLLGAVRHKGFIPWDDDIDICMLRNDYEKFLLSFKNDKYLIANYRTGKGFPLIFSKVFDSSTEGYYYGKKVKYGVAVDVFPIDAFPKDNFDKFYKKYFKLYRLYAFATFYHSKENLFKHYAYRICNLFFPKRYLAKKIDLYVRQFPISQADFVGNIINSTTPKPISKNVFSECILFPFEDRKFFIPKDYNQILVSKYGENYMTPPPEKERVSKHDEEYFRK